MSEEESRERAAIKFLLEALEEATVKAKVYELTLKLLVPPAGRKPLIDTFLPQIAQQASPVFARLRELMLSRHEPSLSRDQEEEIRRLIESAHEPDAPT